MKLYPLISHTDILMPFYLSIILDLQTTDTASSASLLDLYLEFDDSDQLSTKIYDKLNFIRDKANLFIALGQ
jgi:hypothetical protein